MSQLSSFLHTSTGNSLFGALAGTILSLIEANNPKYQPVIQAGAVVLNAELQSLAAGNPPTPHTDPTTTPPAST